MDFYYKSDDGHYIDEATFWEYVRFTVRKLYNSLMLDEKGDLYSVEYWGDCKIDSVVLKFVLDNELNKCRYES